MELKIARAGLESVTEAGHIIREAADWLIAKGQALWGPNETSYAELERVTRAGELVIGRVGEEAAACMFLHEEDRLFWPNARPAEAFYIHRLAVARKYAGRGYAQAMLDWAAAEARARGRAFVRLDCEPREKLLKLYRDAGFAPVDSRPIRVGEHLVIRHQRRVLPKGA